jgi:uncharacterized protein YpmB
MRGIVEQTIVYIVVIIVSIVLIIFFMFWLSSSKLGASISSAVASFLQSIFGPLAKWL